MAYDPDATTNTAHCVICMDKFSDDKDKDLVQLKCNQDHIFHKECIEQNIKSGSKKCPICREEIIIDDDMGMDKDENA